MIYGELQSIDANEQISAHVKNKGKIISSNKLNSKS